MTMMNSSTWRRRALHGGWALAALTMSAATWAQVGNLPGGPAVNQLDLHRR